MSLLSRLETYAILANVNNVVDVLTFYAFNTCTCLFRLPFNYSFPELQLLFVDVIIIELWWYC